MSVQGHIGKGLQRPAALIAGGGQLQALRTSSVLLTANDTTSSAGSACTVLHRASLSVKISPGCLCNRRQGSLELLVSTSSAASALLAMVRDDWPHLCPTRGICKPVPSLQAQSDWPTQLAVQRGSKAGTFKIVMRTMLRCESVSDWWTHPETFPSCMIVTLLGSDGLNAELAATQL